jgi:hypothetical protein
MDQEVEAGLIRLQFLRVYFTPWSSVPSNRLRSRDTCIG